MLILQGGDGKPRVCESCRRTISVDKHGKLRKHKPKRSHASEAWCRGFIPEDEKRAKALFSKAHSALTQLAMSGSWGHLEHVSRETLKACGVPE